jgi:hypothetical protein
MKELYLEDQGNVAGPYPVDQIRELLQNGSITADHLASETAEGPWLPLHTFGETTTSRTQAQTRTAGPGPVGSHASDAPDFHTFVSRFLDALVKMCTSPFWHGEQTARFYEAYQDFVCRIGQYSLLACGVVTFFITGLLSAKTNSGVPLIGGILFAFVMVIGHYLAIKFSAANRKLLHCDTAYLGSDAVPSSLAMLFLLIVIGLVLGGGVAFLALMGSNLIGAILAFLLSLTWAFSLYHTIILSRECKTLLHIDTDEADITGGQVFLSTLKFLARLQLAWSFISLGASGCSATLGLILSGLFLAVSSNQAPPPPSPMGMGGLGNYANAGAFDGLMAGYENLGWGIGLAFWTALLPLICHFIYLLTVFLVDVLNSIIRTSQNTERIP